MLLPIFIIALAVKLSSIGKVFYLGKRVGKTEKLLVLNLEQ